ncbi:MAG: DedA family protein [Fimbriimonas sp.]|nr:DedA family protein [Fimbriimonas sp.]
MGGILHLLLHLDTRIATILTQYGTWAYLIFFLIVFAETGLVVTPFLPGDTLLFAIGLFASKGALSLPLSLFLLILAALSGDQVNYHAGKFLGERLFKNENSKIFKRSNLDKTHEYFERRGPSTVIFARFIPIIRTTAPFVAGMGTMQWKLFTVYSFVAALLWVGICMMAGYLFGGIPSVRDNFGLAALGMLMLSLVPLTYEILSHRAHVRKMTTASQKASQVQPKE